MEQGETYSPTRRDRRFVEDNTSSPVRSSSGSERTRRSELHERDVTQLRTESRLGSRNDDDTDSADRSRDSGFHKYSPRKSTTLIRSSNFHDKARRGSTMIERPSYDANGRHSAAPSERGTMSAEFRLPDKEVRRAYRATQAGDSSDSDDSTELNPKSSSYEQTLARHSITASSLPEHAPKSTSQSVQTSEDGSKPADILLQSHSASHSRSQKYITSSASDLHRTASRKNMQHEQPRQSMSHSNFVSSAPRRSLSPSERTDRSFRTTSSGNGRLAAATSPHTPSRALEDLRMKVEDMHISETSRMPQASSSSEGRLLTGTQSSLGLRTVGHVASRSQSGVINSLTPVSRDRLQRLPVTDPQRARLLHEWALPVPGPVSDSANRIQKLVSQRKDDDAGRQFSLRSSTSMGMISNRLPGSPGISLQESAAGQEPAPITNMSVRFAQLKSLYEKVPTIGATSSDTGPQTSRMLELLGAIVTGTTSIWSELARLHPIATEGHLMGANHDSATRAFGHLDEGLAFVNRLTLEQARAVQDLLFVLDRMEKERQTQLNKMMQELGHSPRPFSRVGDRASSSLSRASIPRSLAQHMPVESPAQGSPFARSERGVTLTASQLRSMTSLGHASHMRSSSELSPSSSAALRRVHRVRQLEDTASAAASILPPRSTGESNVFTSPSTHFASLVESIDAPSVSTRPPPSFTPRRPRLSHPSVSNATASYQPSAASLSPDDSASGARRRREGEASEQTEDNGRASQQSSAMSIATGDITPNGSRSRHLHRTSTLRGGSDHRVIDTLTNQLETLGKMDVSPITPNNNGSSRRHTLMSVGRSEASAVSAKDEFEGPSQVSAAVGYAGTTKSPKPPRPPRNAHRPSDENLSPTKATLTADSDDALTALQGDTDAPGSPGFHSLGNAASRRITRLLGTQATPPSL